MSGSTACRRKLWTMTCESVFQLLAAALSPAELEKLCRKHRVTIPQATCGYVALYQTAHKQCHHDAPFSRQLQQYLNRKHPAVLKRFAATSPELVRRTVEAVLMANGTGQSEDIAGVLWAVASDPRPAMRPVEQWLVDELHLLSHGLLLAHFRGDSQRAPGDQAGAQAQLAALQAEVDQLRASCQAFRASLQELQQQKAHLAQDKADLCYRLEALTAQHAALQQQLAAMPSPPIQPSDSGRALRKLHYQVAKLTAGMAERDAELQRLRTLVRSYTALLDASAAGDPEPERPPGGLSTLPTQMLQGKKVALIGGLDGATPHYERVIQELGGCCLRHDGEPGQGRKRLAEVIKQADVVFCPVDCNSHSAATTTKKLCRALRKPCYFLRSSGVSHLREKLLEITGQAY